MISKRKMTKKKADKAKKQLAYWRETLQDWRASYVERLRDPNFQRIKGVSDIYERTLEAYKENMQECKEMIAKFERLVL